MKIHQSQFILHFFTLQFLLITGCQNNSNPGEGSEQTTSIETEVTTTGPDTLISTTSETEPEATPEAAPVQQNEMLYS